MERKENAFLKREKIPIIDESRAICAKNRSPERVATVFRFLLQSNEKIKQNIFKEELKMTKKQFKQMTAVLSAGIMGASLFAVPATVQADDCGGFLHGKNA